MKRAEDVRGGKRPESPTAASSSQFKLDPTKLFTPLPLGRSTSMNTRRESDKASASADPNAELGSNASGSKFAELTSAATAPLNDAAASIASLVNTAERSIVKAVTFIKKTAVSSPASQPIPLAKDSAINPTGENGERASASSASNPLARRTSLPRSDSEGIPEAKPNSPGAGTVTQPLKTTKSDSSIMATLSLTDDDDVTIGVLSKWINIGRGWGPRLFVLEGGVLSYYKVEGPEKVSVRMEMAKHRSTQLLGEDVRKALLKEGRDAEKGKAVSFGSPVQKPLGSVHLLVANVRASKSDDKKFYIYSGTKTLDLRADSSEDREKWIEILQAAKRRVEASLEGPEDMAAARASAGGDEAVSLLLGRLRESGLGEAHLAEVEETLRNEVVGVLQRTLKHEQLRIRQLQRRVKELETEKAQLETAVVDQTMSNQPNGELQEVDEECAPCEAVGDEAAMRMGAHGDDDDDGEDNFFEALTEFIESASGRLENSGRSLRVPVDMEKVGFDYPAVPRRAALPPAQQEEVPVSLWSIIKDCVGKDVSRITLPVFFNEPISTLQKCAEELEYSWLLDRAAVYGNQGNQLMRALHVAAFALSGYACTEGRVQKPFNPMIGETFEAEYPDKGWRFVAEKMQHNPNVVACHCEGRGWAFWGDCNMRIRFWGPSMQLDPLGVLTVRFDDGEEFAWSKVTTGIYNLILGKLYIDHYGTMKITSNRNGMMVHLRFKERSIFDRNIHQVQGYAQDASGKKLATLMGKWSEHLHFVLGDPASAPGGADEKALLKDAQLLWRANERSQHCGKYKLTPFAVTLNEITPGLKEWLPPTDSRLRPDQRLLEEGIYDRANEEKLRLEQKQREARKRGEEGWHGRWFEQRGPHNTWTYTGKYWDRRNAHDWSGVKDYFAHDGVQARSSGPASVHPA